MENILKKRTKYLPPIQHNIVKYLLSHGATIRDELEKGLNIPHTTAYDNLRKLEKKKIVLRFSKPNNKKGRPYVYWTIKQAYDLVLFKVHGLMLFTKQEYRLVLPNKPKKNKKIIRYGKLPKWGKKIMLDEVKYLTYILKKLDLNSIKPKKTFENTNSYILTNIKLNLTKLVLDEINKCTYFRTASLSNHIVGKILNIKYAKIEEEYRRSASNKIGRIIKELNKLGIVIKHTGSVRSVWKNLYKGNLYAILDEKMEQNYFMVKMKKEK